MGKKQKTQKKKRKDITRPKKISVYKEKTPRVMPKSKRGRAAGPRRTKEPWKVGETRRAGNTLIKKIKKKTKKK